MIRFFRRPGIFAAVLLFLLTAASCAAGELSGRSDLPAVTAARDASFAAVFPAAYEGGEEVRCAGIRAGDTVTLTVTEPARMAGLTVTLREDGEGGYRTEISGPDFPAPAPVDPAAARALTDVFVLLYGTDSRAVPGGDGGAEDVSLFVPTVSRSGEETVFRYAAGTLTFDGAGMPSRIACRDLAGGERIIVLEDYVMEEP